MVPMTLPATSAPTGCIMESAHAPTTTPPDSTAFCRSTGSIFPLLPVSAAVTREATVEAHIAM